MTTNVNEAEGNPYLELVKNTDLCSHYGSQYGNSSKSQKQNCLMINYTTPNHMASRLQKYLNINVYCHIIVYNRQDMELT